MEQVTYFRMEQVANLHVNQVTYLHKRSDKGLLKLSYDIDASTILCENWFTWKHCDAACSSSKAGSLKNEMKSASSNHHHKNHDEREFE